MSNLIPEARIYETEAPQLEAVGLDQALPPLKRDQDGHIDFDFYLRKGRDERAKAASAFFLRIGKTFAALARIGEAESTTRRNTHYV